jgi:hypothetical protein
MSGRSTIDQLKLDLELEGYEPGTPQFDVMLRQRQVEHCVEMKELPSCETCPAYFDCEIIKAHLRDLRYGVEIDQDGPDGGAGAADRSGSGAGG